MCVDVNNREEG